MPVMAVKNGNQHEQTGDYRSRPRWSVGKKIDAVLRLLRGEPLETLSCIDSIILRSACHEVSASQGEVRGKDWR
jgi:hypothetical protein